MVKRRYKVLLAESVRRYETITIETEQDIEAMLDPTVDAVPQPVLDLLADGDVVATDYGECDEPDYYLEIIEVEEVVPNPPPEVRRVLSVPYPPTTAVQAQTWVRWAVTEIGLGWHPDTSGKELVTNGPIGCEARCACGETFNPNDLTDTIHGEREDGEPCGLHGVIVGTWGTPVALFSDKDVRGRYDAGLAAAHELLPDIYATSMEILRELHPDLLTTTKGV